MSGVYWTDEGQQDRTRFQDDTHKASEGLKNEAAASELLDRAISVRTAGLSGSQTLKRETQVSEQPVDFGASEMSDGGNSTRPFGTSEGSVSHAGVSNQNGNKIVSRWRDNRSSASGTSHGPVIAAAHRDVEIKPRVEQPASMAQSPKEDTVPPVPAEPLSAVMPVNQSHSASRRSPSTAQVIAAGVVRRKIGHQGTVRKTINRYSMVHEGVNRWLQDDESMQGYTQTVRGAVQAATIVGNAGQFGAWTWQKSLGIARNTAAAANGRAAPPPVEFTRKQTIPLRWTHIRPLYPWGRRSL